MILFRFVFVVFTVLAFAPSTANTAESLAFTDKNLIENKDLEKVLSSYEYLQFAPVDLNNDSISEYILITDTLNEFEIIAIKDDLPVSLGTIDALKLMVSHDQTHGVRSLLVFSDPKNDYDYDVYKWDAINSSYALDKNLDVEAR